MAIRTYVEILPAALCAGPYTPGALQAARLVCPGGGLAQVPIWCRGCNLVYCHLCAHPARHHCPVLARVEEINAAGRGREISPDGQAWLRRHNYKLTKAGRWVYPYKCDTKQA